MKANHFEPALRPNHQRSAADPAVILCFNRVSFICLYLFMGHEVSHHILVDPFLDPTQTLLPVNMVGTSVLGKLRMRKQNTKTTVPLDVAPERRTKRCSPRFRPEIAFVS